MERRIGVSLAVLTVVLGACSAPPDRDAERIAERDGWVEAAAFDTVQRRPGSLVVHGSAAPGARVVLRGAAGGAFAASADEQGVFELRVAPPAADQLYRAEIQAGQDAAQGPDWLLVTTASQGPIAVLTPGSASRRLDRHGLIEAVDHDGRAMLVSGSAPPGATVELTLDGQPVAPAAAGPEGRWTANLGSAGAGPVRLGVRAEGLATEAAYPGHDQSGAGAVSVEAISGGVRVIWSGPAGARQSAWFPQPVSANP